MGAKHSKDKKTDVKRLVPFLDVDVNVEIDDRCSISGITCLKDGRIVVADFLGKYIKYYDTKSLQMLDYLQVDTAPYEVCSSAESDVFVSLPFEQKILHLRAGDKLELIKEIQAEGMCYGISCFNAGLAVSLRLEKSIWQIEILDFNGSVQKVFKDDNDGSEMFGFPDYLTTDKDGSRLYVSDGSLNTVTAFNLKDSTMVAIDVIFRYSDRHLRIPKGMTLDAAGNLFVIGCESSNVHKISRTGKRLGVVLTHKDELTMPMGCCYDSEERKVFVTEGSRKVMIFKDDSE